MTTSGLKEGYIGKVYRTNNYGDVKIIEFYNKSYVKVVFLNTMSEKFTSISTLKKGSLKDKQAPSILGFGIVGEDIPSRGGIQDRAYGAWHSMLQRCLCENTQRKYPTYIGCTVHDDWRYYQNFKKWFYSQVGSDMSDYQLDKDLLVRGNTLYSPETCCLLPRSINNYLSLLPVYGCTQSISFKTRTKQYMAVTSQKRDKINLGDYRTYKEAFIALKTFKQDKMKEFALQHKGNVSEVVYQKLMNFDIYCE